MVIARFFVCLVLVLTSGALASAQGPPAAGARRVAQPPAGSRAPAPRAAAAAPAGTRIALIDMKYLFDNHSQFQQDIKRIQTDVKGFDDAIQNQRKQLSEMRKQLDNGTPGTAQYRTIEASIAQQVSDMKLKMELKRRDVLQLEADVYHGVYQKVQAAVDHYARQQGIGLVIRYDSTPIDPSDRMSVLSGVNRPIVYHQNLDITREILQMVSPAATAQRPPQPGSPRGPQQVPRRTFPQ